MIERGLSFGSVAAAYEQFRPGYPPRLVDEILTYAQMPIRTALEIGAGTGKATRVFAARGISVTATDPDAAMLAELAKHVPSTVSTKHAAFEDLPLVRTYDLVFAAAAMHWTEPVHRWSRVSALLNANGVFAAFGGQLQLADEAVNESVRAIGRQFHFDDGITSLAATPPDEAMRWPATELCQSDQLTDIREVVIDRLVVMPALDYIGHLATISAYIQLPASVRDKLFDEILAVLPNQVRLKADLTLHLARRPDRWPR